jgi:beta-aspartyl-peptidase (threonine type)
MKEGTNDEIVIAVHTGASYEELISEVSEKEYKCGIKEALLAGYKILKKGGVALDAAEQACIKLEDNPLFNAGRGSVLNNKGFVELDASIMDGCSLQTGSVVNVTTIKNPIRCARKLLENNKYIFLGGKGAEEFAELNKLELVSNDYFQTEKRKLQLEKIKSYTRSESSHWLDLNEATIIQNYGTVGVVCRDKFGNLASATSTGGTCNKPLGRIGDSAIIGAGTYANNDTCGVSCTGKGEPIIRVCNAFSIHSMMKHGGKDLMTACETAMQDLKDINAFAGYIAVDKDANVVMMYDTAMMGRGYIKNDKMNVFVYDEKRDLTPCKYDIDI